MWSTVRSVVAFGRYNATQVFAGKFIYFLLLALLVFCTVVVVQTAQEEVPPDAAAIYYYLLVPAVMLVFYPAAYCIQGDVDARMLETLFGIPDYRYKVWLVRLVVQQLVVAVLVLGLAALCQAALADFSIGLMVFHVMFPILFLGSLGFMAATLTRNGNGAAAILLIVGLFCWMMAPELLQGSRWNLYLNPFQRFEGYEALDHQTDVFYNRVGLLVGSGLAALTGLLRLQKRESFV